MKNKIIIVLSFLVIGCGKKDKLDSGSTPVIQSPTAAFLLSPTQNETCVTGTIISDTESKITFTWKQAEQTESYDLIIKNLLTNTQSSQSVNGTELQISLLRNTPYSWYVVSKSSKTNQTAKSNVWKFYNSGHGIIDYAPFPAALTSPAQGEIIVTSTGKVDLKWNGVDVDRDIVDYDVYFGSNDSPALFKKEIKEMMLKDVPVKTGVTYYWKIVTRDAKNNTSISGISLFTIK